MRWTPILILIAEIIAIVNAMGWMYTYLTLHTSDPFMLSMVRSKVAESLIILFFISQIVPLLSDEEGTGWD